MSQKTTFNRLENNFWNIAIQLLSESQITRKLMLIGYSAYHKFQAFPSLGKLTIWAVIGWILGYFLGYLVSTVIYF